MLTSKECLTKADHLDRLGLESGTPLGRVEYARLADEWRSVAALAGRHEAWAAEHPAWRLDIEHLTKDELLEMRAELQRLLDRFCDVRSLEPDPRGLIVRCDAPERIARIRERITQLDLVLAEHEARLSGGRARRRSLPTTRTTPQGSG